MVGAGLSVTIITGGKQNRTLNPGFFDVLSAETMAADELPADLPADAVILIAGPPMTGKYELLFRLLAGSSDGAIFISTKNGAARVIEDYRSAGGDVTSDRLGVVDCVSRDLGRQATEDGTHVRYVSGPADLTSIGVEFTELSRELQEQDVEQVAVGLHSVSQLVMHADLQQVYKFLQVLTGQIRTAGWHGAAVVDEPAWEGEEAAMLEQHFDGVIHTREDEASQREYRIRSQSTTTDWTPF